MAAHTPFHQTPEGCRLLGVGRRAIDLGEREVGVQMLRTRSLPGARLARVPRFGRGLDADELEVAVDGFRALAGEARVPRVNVEVYAEDPAQHAAIEAVLAAGGFSRIERPMSYEHTLWMDLGPSEDELLMSIHRSARRNVRLPARRGHRVDTLGPGTSVPELEGLYGEAFRSTGAEPPEVDWQGWLEVASARPELVHMVGIRREDDPSLLGFAVGISHGDVCEYHHAASTRDRESGVPLLYAPLWELVRWARSSGAGWFDFGGVSVDADDDDPLQGISDFKRFFCRDLVRVGGEWELDPDSVVGSLWKTARWLKSAGSGG